jgi:outer membrane lipoprotein-sorting protein
MKLTVKSIASVTLVTLLMGITPTRANTPSQLLLTGKSTNISQNQKNKQVNVDFLAQAIRNFWQSDRYLTESVITLSGKINNSEFKTTSNIKTIAQSGEKFRSEIAFGSPNDAERKQYLLVSNGEKVWIYRSDTKEYAVVSHADFKETFLIGMSSVLFMSFPEDARGEISKSVNSARSFLNDTGVLKNSQLAEGNTVIDGESFTTYTYKDVEDGVNIKAFVDSTSAILKQIEFSGKFEGINVLITEQISQRTAKPTITKETFTFSPPPGVKQVDSLSINPFE